MTRLRCEWGGIATSWATALSIGIDHERVAHPTPQPEGGTE